MKNKINKELILRIAILLVCASVLFIIQSNVSVRAQTRCSGPPITTDILTYPSYPTNWAWLKGTAVQEREVSVKIFDTPDEIDFQIIDTAIRKWNDQRVANCSYVTFEKAERATFPYDDTQQPPDNTIWVARLLVIVLIVR